MGKCVDQMRRLAFQGLALWVLAGCMGGASSGAPGLAATGQPPPGGPAQIAAEYKAFGDEGGTVRITGNGINRRMVRQNGTSVERLSVRDLTGRVNLATGVITLTDGVTSATFSLNTTNGPDYDRNSVGLVSDYQGLRLRDHFRGMRLIRPNDGFATTAGFAGFATQRRDMPQTGRAALMGEAFVTMMTDSTNAQGIGQATVAVDFGTGTADVSMTDFQMPDAPIPNARVPRDLTLTGMVIDGRTMSGGQLTGDDVALVGGNTQFQAVGGFYGYNARRAGPATAAGSFVMVGDAGSIDGTFAAD